MTTFISPPPAVGTHLVAITPNDTTVFSPPLSALWVGGAGNIAVLAANDTVAVTISTVAAGTLLRFVAVQKVMATNTTATLIYGSY